MYIFIILHHTPLNTTQTIRKGTQKMVVICAEIFVASNIFVAIKFNLGPQILLLHVN